MNAKQRSTLQALPTSENVWLCVVRRMPAWVNDGHAKPSRPLLVMIIDVADGTIVGDNVVATGKSLQTIVDQTLQSAMLSPKVSGKMPSRPVGIVFERADVLATQQEELQALGIGTQLEPVMPEVDNLLREMAESIGKGPPISGVIELLAHDLDATRRFFADAAEFYRRAPWQAVFNAHVIEVRFPAQALPQWVVIMGNGGEEFGIALYKSLDALNAQFSDDQVAYLASGSTQTAVTFNKPWDGASFADLDAIEMHGFEIAGEPAYPMLLSMILKGKPKMVPAARADLDTLQALLHVLPDFVLSSQHMDAGKQLPIPAATTVSLAEGYAAPSMALTFPAPGLTNRPPMRGDDAPSAYHPDNIPPELADAFRELEQILGSRAAPPKRSAPATKSATKPTTKKRPAKPIGPKDWVRLKVSLRGSAPLIWRRIEVPADIQLDKLHAVLQAAVGWFNGHLHQFYKRAGRGRDIQFYGMPDPENDLDGPSSIDERTVRLNELIGVREGKLVYEYDFGDSWEHELVIERVIASDQVPSHVRCIDGARACPPEDVGGVYGYRDFLEAIADAGHSQHAELLEWVGGEFDPAAFNPEQVSARMRHIKL